MPKRVSIYTGDELRAYLGDEDGPDGSRSARINALADRYLYILDGVRLPLSREELALIREADHGTVHSPAAIGLPGIVSNLADAIRLDRLDEKHGVDGAALTTRLREASRAELAWLAEKLERPASKEE